MELFGWTIARTKSPTQLQAPHGGRGWWPLVREPYAGAWQSNVTVDQSTVLTHAAVFACIGLIAGDIGKLRPKFTMRDSSGVWAEVFNRTRSPLLTKPNHYQTRIQFIETWVRSKLIHGNAYILKSRDSRGIVDGLYVLDPLRCQTLVASNGDVYYGLKPDRLSGVEQDPEPSNMIVPAREIIHDLTNAMYHPLIGLSPITACGIAAMQGLRIQETSTLFFQNRANPSGVLTAPGYIKDETAARVKEYWDESFSGSNAGRVAVLGDGLKYEAMTVTAVDSQLIEQLRWTAENVCTAFRVPAYMVGAGPAPKYDNLEGLVTQYYTQCLQSLIESIELLLDAGLGLASDEGIEFDLDGLSRLDMRSRTAAAREAVGAGVMTPNEARLKYFNLPPVPGGDSPYLQVQNYSLEALSKRDAKDDPFASAPKAVTP